MLTCEINNFDNLYSFECLDSDGLTVLQSIDYSNKNEVLEALNSFLLTGYKDYVYEVCDGEDCYYFKIRENDIILLESRRFDDNESAYEMIRQLQGGCQISYIIDRSFDSGKIIYYLSCTEKIRFKKPLSISIEREGEEYIGSIPDLHLFAYNKNIPILIEELKEDIDDLYSDLFVENHNLSKGASNLKSLFGSKIFINGI